MLHRHCAPRYASSGLKRYSKLSQRGYGSAVAVPVIVTERVRRFIPIPLFAVQRSPIAFLSLKTDSGVACAFGRLNLSGCFDRSSISDGFIGSRTPQAKAVERHENNTGGSGELRQKLQYSHGGKVMGMMRGCRVLPVR